ncbi:MAG: dihydrodipicolinate synthase family protein [Acidimicrobiales bacterium]|nr:MAG: dihydrodipicolinate synthase family protein [Acidimicrobiales bacterium]
MDLTGVFVPLVTPFDESDNVDLDRVETIVESMLAAGVHGIVACGTTGEGYSLSLDERRAVTSRIHDVVAGSVPVLGAVGGMSTAQALEHAAITSHLRLDGLMLTAPAYSLPTPTELADHVSTVVAAAGLPTVLYDYPQRTGVPFSFDTLDQLASNPLIVGIKEASGDLTRPGEITRRYAGAIDVVCGADAAIVDFLDAGTRCWIGGIANLLPVAHVAILDPSARADAYHAIAPVLTFIEAGQYNAKVKAGMALRGLDVGKPRGPVTAIDDVTRNELHALLDAAGYWTPVLTTA